MIGFSISGCLSARKKISSPNVHQKPEIVLMSYDKSTFLLMQFPYLPNLIERLHEILKELLTRNMTLNDSNQHNQLDSDIFNLYQFCKFYIF